MPRQYGERLDDIRADHVERYELASSLVYGDILDAACGCGYGSFILAIDGLKGRVFGVDISANAINYANRHWRCDNNNFSLCDLNSIEVIGRFDWLVCFETIEHLENPGRFLKIAAKYCQHIICSVPNENIIPKTPGRYKYHYRHYTRKEIVDLLEECGFTVDEVMFQRNHLKTGFLRREEGRTIVIRGKSREFKYSDTHKAK